MDVLVEIVHFTLLIFVSCRVSRAIFRDSLTDTVLSAFVLVSVQAALIIQVLSLFNALDRWNVVGWHALLSLFIFFAARNITDKNSAQVDLGPVLHDSLERLPRYLVALVSIFLVIKLFQLLQVIALPLVVEDVTTYHAPRVVLWAQNASITHFPTWEQRQNFNPKGGYAIPLELYLLSRSLDLFEIMQWVSSITIPIAVLNISRLYGATFKNAVIVGLAAGCLPIIVTQSITGQNDLLFSAYALSFLYFSVKAVHLQRWSCYTLAVASLGMAFATKLLMVWLFLPFGVILIFEYFRSHETWGRAAMFCSFCLLSLVALGGYAIAENYFYFGTLFSAPGYSGVVRLNSFEDSLAIFLRYIYQMVDPSGLPKFVALGLMEWRDRFFYLFNDTLKKNVSGHSFHTIAWAQVNHPVHSWFGLQWIFSAIVGAFFAVGYLRKKGPSLVVLLLPLLCMLAINTVFLHYTTARGRYFIVGAALCFVPFSLWMTLLERRFEKIHARLTLLSAFQFMFSIVAIISICSSVIYDQKKGGYFLDSKIRNVSVNTYEFINELARRDKFLNSKVGILQVEQPLLFMPTSSRSNVKFLFVRTGRYHGLAGPQPSFKTFEDLEAFAAENDVDIMIGHIGKLSFDLEDSACFSKMILSDEYFAYSSEGW